MPTDISRPLKFGVITHLAGNPAVTAVVPVERIFALQAPATPQWPFIRYGSPITSGYEATCWDGAANRVTLHAFAQTQSGISGEDQALDIAALIVEAMKTFAPDDLAIIENEWLQTNVLRDGDEADRWHSIVEFDITAIPA